MNDRYLNLNLADESYKLPTFYTHRGLKVFKRMHFGVNSSAEIRNEGIPEVVAQDPTTTNICGDILVFGETPGEHDKAHRHILHLWQEQGLFLGLKKSRFNLQVVKVFGKEFSSKGRSPDPEKVAALKAAGPL